MLGSSFTTRQAIFAFLIGPPRPLDRTVGMQIYDAVCERLFEDDLSFQYGTGEALGPSVVPPFQIVLERPQARGAKFQVRVEGRGPHSAVRVLVDSPFPKSRENAFEDIDLAAEAVFEVLGDDWVRVLAETRLRGHLEAKGGSGVTFLQEKVLHLSPGELESLEAPLNFAGIKLETPATDPDDGAPLSNPKREFAIEVLREDPRKLYVELMSQWPQAASIPSPGGTLEVNARRMRSLAHRPGDYLRNSMDYLNSVALPLFSR